MKKISQNLITLLAFALLFSISCTKDRTKDEEKSDKGITLGSTDALYKNNALEEQSFIIDSIHGDTIRGKDGTKIFHVSKTLFMYRDNFQDIHYPFTLKLIEAYSVGNMILAQLPNVAQNKLLESGGEIKITAFKNNRELALKEKRGLNLIMPAKKRKQGMTVFYGFTKGTTNDWNTNVVNTSDYLFQSDSVTWVNPANNDTTNTQIYWGYQFTISKLGWLNCDAFYNYSNLTNITFYTDTTYSYSSQKNIDIFVIFKNLNAYFKANSMSANNVPIGQPITIFAIANDNAPIPSSYYYFKQDFIITSGLKIHITLTSTTEADIKAMLNSF